VHAHGFLFQLPVLALLIGRFMRVKTILTDHGGLQQYSSSTATLAARLAAHTIGRVSTRLAQTLVAYNARIQQEMNWLGGRRDCHFIPNSVDAERFAPVTVSERQVLRQKLGWDDQPVVIFVGRFIATKGVPLLLQAASPKHRTVFCGPGDLSTFGPLPQGVEYLPPRPQAELVPLYQAADLLVLPAAVREGFPLVVQEALSCGTPVILGDDPGFTPYANVPGLHLVRLTVPELRSKMDEVLSTPRPERLARVFPDMDGWLAQLLHAAGVEAADE
ncbi:MAG: glycosyltransferase family 4 protein, partial [Gemmataceae bacterium]